MSNFFINTDHLVDAYCYLAKFDEYLESITEYQVNIKKSFLGAINNPKLDELFFNAEKCLNNSKEKCNAIMQEIDEINSISEWCNEEILSKVKAIAKIIKDLHSTQKIESGEITFTVGKSLLEFVEDGQFKTIASVTIDQTKKILKDLRITKVYEKGYVYLSEYKKSDHLTSRYNTDTYIAKQATKFSFLEKTKLVINGAKDIFFAGTSISNVWKDNSLTVEEKIIDTAAYGICTAAGIALDVGAAVAGKAVTAAIPVPVVNVIVGSAVEFVIGTAADTIKSEAVVNQVSDSIENIVGAAKAGVASVSRAAEELIKSESVGDAVVNTAKLVGSAVVAGIEVISTAVKETVKTVATVVTETVKNIGKKITNFFKGW